MSKYKIEIYQFIDRYGKHHEGSAKEIHDKTGVKLPTIYAYGHKLGTRWLELQVYSKIKRESFVGNIEGAAEFLNLSKTYRIADALKRGGKMRDYNVALTGEVIFETTTPRVDKYEQVGVKPTSIVGRVKIKTQYSHKPVPMSEYGKQLFEWSTRHLRRDA